MPSLVIKFFYFKAMVSAVMQIDITNVLFSSGYLTDPVQNKRIHKVDVLVSLILVSSKCHSSSMFSESLPK